MPTARAKTTLSAAERQDLERLEGTIRAGRAALGKALLEIRDRRLYRATHSSFGAYCLDRWDICARYANRLIAAIPIAENLGKRPGEVPERHLHELDGLPAEAQRAVYERACVGGTPTALRIQEVREAYEAGTLDGPRTLPLPSPRPAAHGNGAEGLIERLRAMAESRGVGRTAGPLLDRLLELFSTRGKPRRRLAQAGA